MVGALMNRFASLEQETSALVETLRRSVVLVSSKHGHGSGVIWSAEGLIVTNDHVAVRQRAQVALVDGRNLEAEVIARDRENDLAVLRVHERDLPAARIGDSRALRVGELIVAVGNPFGVIGTATLGIISATGAETWMGRMRRERLQADVMLAPGNSGGPLANMEGEVVGIANMIVSPGIALAIPSRVVDQFVAQAIRRAA
jgi:serine protease Do